MSAVVTMLDAEGEWETWIYLDDVDHMPPEGLSFIIGRGPTRARAIADAIHDLEDTIQQLKLAL